MNQISSTVRATPSVMPASGCLQYRIYSDLAQIRELSQPWGNVVAASPCNKVFASLEWYLASCRMDTSGVPYVVAATRGTEITGILALLLNRTAGVATFPEYGSDYNDVLVRGSNPQLVADLLRYAISADTPCRHLKLFNLRPDSNCVAALHLLKHDPSVDLRHSAIDAYSYVELPSSFEDYLASLRKKFRSNVRRALRAATAGGRAICELYPHNLDPAELPEIFFHLLLCRHVDMDLSKQIAAQSFVREALPAMFRRRSMRVFAVIEDGRIIAVFLFFVTATGLLAWNGGFLAQKEQWSPGTSLYAFTIRQAIAEGLHEFDFGHGDEGYKRRWANREYSVSEVELISRA